MTTERRHPNVVNQDEVEATEFAKGKHHTKNRRFGPASGSQQLGAMLTELPPGARSFPFHYHCANEEALYVVSGTGTARIGDARVAVRPGDWIALPAGEAYAHQLLADRGEAITYLAISTMSEVDVVTYPDSDKILVGVIAPEPGMRKIFHLSAGNVSYWEGEGNPPLPKDAV